MSPKEAYREVKREMATVPVSTWAVNAVRMSIMGAVGFTLVQLLDMKDDVTSVTTRIPYLDAQVTALQADEYSEADAARDWSAQLRLDDAQNAAIDRLRARDATQDDRIRDLERR